MPDILIRMEMPKDEPLRIFMDANGQVLVDRGVYYDEFEAVELPPHGDLIDRDALGEFPFNMSFCDGYEADEWVQNAPVIIPADKEEAHD